MEQRHSSFNAYGLADPMARGRGARTTQKPRFEQFETQAIDDGWQSFSAVDATPRVDTHVTYEMPRTMITRNTSPDIPFSQSLNTYRGCEHGCSYCFARPAHAYMGLSPGLDFEAKLFAKKGAAKRLRADLAKPGYKMSPLALGTNTDPYQPIEKQEEITRDVLKVLLESGHPCSIVTKSALILRDRDILAEMAAKNLVKVALSITTLGRHLANKLEPRASTPQRRLDAIRILSDLGVPTMVMVAPVIPALTDHELEEILQASAEAGALEAAYILLRLPLEVAPLFKDWLDRHAPDKTRRVLNRLAAMRGGRVNDPRFGHRMRGQGVEADLLRTRFRLASKKAGLNMTQIALNQTIFTPPIGHGDQLSFLPALESA